MSEQAVRRVVLINPQPADRRCEGCGRSADELPAFGQALLRALLWSRITAAQSASAPTGPA